jgi:hypothetical protein
MEAPKVMHTSYSNNTYFSESEVTLEISCVRTDVSMDMSSGSVEIWLTEGDFIRFGLLFNSSCPDMAGGHNVRFDLRMQEKSEMNLFATPNIKIIGITVWSQRE